MTEQEIMEFKFKYGLKMNAVAMVMGDEAFERAKPFMDEALKVVEEFCDKVMKEQ